MKALTLSLFAGIFVLTVSMSASAQDMAATPTYGVQNLTSGFAPDPIVISLLAGGQDSVAVTGSGVCSGFINNAAADVELNYTAGSYPLNIYVKSAADTTLVINQPDGTWICNDDSNGLNPLVSWTAPMSGTYDIWVGNWGSTDTPPATLQISELAPQW